MSETGMLFDHKPGTEIAKGLGEFSRLPGWLVAARDPDRVSGELARLVPEFAQGQLLLQKCEVGHIRYKENHWTGLYHLTTTSSGKEDPQTYTLEGAIFPPGVISLRKPQVEGVFGMQGWYAILPDLNLKLKTQDAETILGSLAFLTDPEKSRQFLMRNIQAGSASYRDIEIHSSNPKVVRYKPGSRCTVLYNLEYSRGLSSDSRWPEIVIAKTYRNEKGKNAFEGMVALWNSSLASSRTVQIAEPLAYNDQERVMIQGHIREETTLKK